MSRSVVNVDFVAEYKGATKLTQMQKDMAALKAGAQALAKSFAAVFAVREIIQFGKDSVLAFAQSEKQAKILSTTLNNLGQGFATLSVSKFLTSIELASGRTKEELLPAFQDLFLATGSVTKAQDGLKLALDISAGTGAELVTVQNALSKGYLGNTGALSKLGAGLDKATLKSGDMNLITKKLGDTFKGQAAAAADTFQGKMDRLNVAMNEAKTIIGSGLVKALTDLGGTGGFPAALKGINDFAVGISDAIIGTERLIKNISFFLNNDSNIFDQIRQAREYNAANSKADMLERQIYGGAAATKYQSEVALANAKAKLKSDQAALKILNDQKKAVADRLALERSQLSLKLAGSVLDIQNIGIQAALQRGQTAEVNNVLLLQRAILNDNADQANILAQEVLKANGLVMDVNGNISSLAKAKDPFSDWPAASKAAMEQLLKIQAELAKIQSKTITVTVNTVYTSSGMTATGSFASTGDKGGAGSATKDNTPGVIVYPSTPLYPDYGLQTTDGSPTVKSAVIPGALEMLKTAESSTPKASNSGGAYDKPIVINITAPASTVVDTTQDASTNGTAVTVNRTNPFGLYSSV